MPFTPDKLVAAGILMQIPIAMVLLSPSSPRSGPALPNMPSSARHSLLRDAQHRKHVLLRRLEKQGLVSSEWNTEESRG